MEFELKNASNTNIGDEGTEPPFELPAFITIHALFKPPPHVLYPFSESAEESDTMDDQIPLPSFIPYVDTNPDPIECEHIRNSAFKIMKCYSASFLMQVSSALYPKTQRYLT